MRAATIRRRGRVLCGPAHPPVAERREPRPGRNDEPWLREARGEYVARLDQDDIALPTRLQRQVAVLDREPNVAVVGSWVDYIDERGRTTESVRKPIDDLPDLLFLLFVKGLPLAHSAVMYRRDLVLELGSYDEAARLAEDTDLWRRIALSRHEARVVPEVLLRYLVHTGSSRTTAGTSNVRTTASATSGSRSRSPTGRSGGGLETRHARRRPARRRRRVHRRARATARRRPHATRARRRRGEQARRAAPPPRLPHGPPELARTRAPRERTSARRVGRTARDARRSRAAAGDTADAASPQARAPPPRRDQKPARIRWPA